MTTRILVRKEIILIILTFMFASCSIFETRNVDKLIKQLNEPSLKKKCSAIKKLGEIGDRKAVVPLIACLNSSFGDVQEDAAIALGLIGDRAAVIPLINCLTDDKSYVSDSAAIALSRIGDTIAIQPWIDYKINKIKSQGLWDRESYEENCNWGQSTFGIMVVDRLMASLKTEIIADTRDVNFSPYYKLLVELGQGAVEPLIGYLKDKKKEIRYLTVNILGEIGNHSATMPLISCLNDSDAYLRSIAASSLGEIGDHSAVIPLISCLKDSDAYLRRIAAKSLGEIRDNSAVIPLISCLKDRNENVRYEAVLSLGEIRDSSSVEPLFHFLKVEKDEFVIHAFCDALYNLGDRRVIPYFVAQLPSLDRSESIFTKLEEMGWLPKTETESVYYWIYKKDAQRLFFNWEQIKRVLINDLRSDSGVKRRHAVYSLIHLGREDVIEDLVQIIFKHGDRFMAETYLNCGNSRLKEAGNKWALNNGYSINSVGGTASARWGKW